MMGMYGDLWGEMARLQREMDQLFRPDAGLGIRSLARRPFPVINVGTTPEAVEVLALTPGLEPHALQVTVDHGLLMIAGERPATEAGEGGHVHAKERFEGAFKRVVSLPEDVDAQKVEARCKDGLLHIRVPRQASAQPRRIDVH